MKLNNMRAIPLVPNAITAFGLTCGLFVIFKVNMVDPGEENYHALLAVVGIMLLAAVADLLDGAVARAMKLESAFGGLFDSLADAISFGVAPVVVVLKSLSVAPGSYYSFATMLGGILYSLCGVLRLVRFNINTMGLAGGDTRQIATPRGVFVGMPIPAGAAALLSANLFLVSPGLQNIYPVSDLVRAAIMVPVMILVGYLMISRWRFPSAKAFRIRVGSFSLVFVVAFLAVVLFYGLLYAFPLVFVLVTWTYVLFGAFFCRFFQRETV